MWQPIDTAPKDGLDLLARDKFGQKALVYWSTYIKPRWQPNGCSWGSFDATEWLPASRDLPKSEQN